MVGRSPVAFLHLEVPPEEVDVNVHPTKVEVRFRDAQRIYSQLLATLRQTFLASDLHSRLQAPPSRRGSDTAAEPVDRPFRLPERPDARQEVASWFAPNGTPAAVPDVPEPRLRGRAGFRRTGDVPIDPPRPRPDRRGPRPTSTSSPRPRRRASGRAGRPSPKPAPESGPRAVRRPRPAGQGAPGPRQLPRGRDRRRDGGDRPARPPRADLVRGVEVADRARGRRVAAPARPRAGRPGAVRGGGGPGASRGPGQPRPGGRGRSATARSWSAASRRCSPASRPTGCSATWPTTSGPKPLPPTRDAILEDVLSMIACKAAVKAGQKLAPDEVTALLERRHLVSDAHHCPHGRPTALVFTKSELERQFGRI